VSPHGASVQANGAATFLAYPLGQRLSVVRAVNPGGGHHDRTAHLFYPAICHNPVALALATALPLTAARAADQPAPTSNGTNLEQVVVTAQKRVERLHNVPISVAVLGGKELLKQNITNIDDLGTKIPNVELVLPFGPEEPQFSIRGVTETDFQPSQSSPVALYVDGTYKSVGALTAMALFDIDRIEVLRGPQGTLQGRNATGGAVNIYTVKPALDQFGGYITAGIGNYGRYETQGALNVPIVNDKLAIRAAWTYTSVDGYIKNVAPNAPFGGNLAGVDDFGGRVSVLFTPNDRLSAILRVNYFYSDPVNYGVYAKDIPAGEGIGIPNGALCLCRHSLQSLWPQRLHPGRPGLLRQQLGRCAPPADDQSQHRLPARLRPHRYAETHLHHRLRPGQMDHAGRR
jgi:hypothetical protein